MIGVSWTADVCFVTILIEAENQEAGVESKAIAGIIVASAFGACRDALWLCDV